VFVILLIGYFTLAKAKPNVEKVLYTNLSTSDSQTVMGELSKMGVAYSSADNGKSITIDGAEIPKVRMDLANLGIPHSGQPGLELFDTTSLGATKFEKDVKYMRALKGQLENDLAKGIDGVERATIQLSLSSEDNFFKDPEPSKATVILKLRQGVHLNESQIKGVQNVISAAVQRLNANEVIVLDELGNILSDLSNGTQQPGVQASKQAEIVAQSEDRVKNDIMKSLSTIYGYDHVRVNVRASINFDEIVRNIEKYDPVGAVISRNNKTEKSTKTGAVTSTQVGTASNGTVPQYTAGTSPSQDTFNQDNQQLIENFDVGKTVETIKKNPELVNTNVVVWIDKTMSDADAKKLEQSIAIASGITDKNNDGIYDNGEVKVTPVLFNQNATNQPEKDVTSKPVTTTNSFFNQKTVLTFVMIGIAICVLVLLILFIFRRREDKDSKKIIQRYRDRSTADAIEDEEEGFSVAGGVYGESNRLKREVAETAEKNPERSADYIRKLINEN
jgi:flagellar M-ring protein FliF